jgi:phage shock protein PspC (stress-responsive transcriptional regulator)
MYHVKRLRKGDRRFLGVVGGIVKHLNVDADPFWPRVATLIACIIQPLFILIYIGFALALPEESYKIPENEVNEDEPDDPNLLGKDGKFKEKE